MSGAVKVLSVRVGMRQGEISELVQWVCVAEKEREKGVPRKKARREKKRGGKQKIELIEPIFRNPD